MTTNFQLPPELSINSIARELESAGLAQTGQGVDPDDVLGLLLLTPQLLRLLNSAGEDGNDLPIPSPVVRSQRLDELEGKALGVTAAGGTAGITVETPANMRIVKIFEVVGDSDSDDFDVEIFEDAARTRLNRVYRNITNDQHFVDRLLEGLQYQDRDGGDGQADRIYIRITNNAVADQDITVRVKFKSERTVS